MSSTLPLPYYYPQSLSRRTRRLLRLACAAAVVLASLIAILAVRSFRVWDTLTLAACSSINGADGSSWEAFIGSERGTIRFNLNQYRVHSTVNPVDPDELFNNRGPSLLSVPAEQAVAGLPTTGWAAVMQKRNLPGYVVHSIGFDEYGFGAGRLSTKSISMTSADWVAHSHTAVRVPDWFVPLLLLAFPTVFGIRAIRRRNA